VVIAYRGCREGRRDNRWALPDGGNPGLERIAFSIPKAFESGFGNTGKNHGINITKNNLDDMIMQMEASR